MVLVAANLKAKKLGGFLARHGALRVDGRLTNLRRPAQGANLAPTPVSACRSDAAGERGPGRRHEGRRQGPAALRRPQRDLLLQGQAASMSTGACSPSSPDGSSISLVAQSPVGHRLGALLGSSDAKRSQRWHWPAAAIVVRAQQRRAGAVARQVQRGRAPPGARRRSTRRTPNAATLSAIRAEASATPRSAAWCSSVLPRSASLRLRAAASSRPPDAASPATRSGGAPLERPSNHSPSDAVGIRAHVELLRLQFDAVLRVGGRGVAHRRHGRVVV